MPQSQATPIQVVVAFDFSPPAEVALQRAVEMALRAPQHVLHVVAVLDSRDRMSVLNAGEAPTYDAAERVHDMVLRHVTAAFAGREAEDVQFYVHARIGKPAAEILALASEIGADLIFVGTHGAKGLERLVLGSVSEHVVREAGCAVIVARAKRYEHVELAKVIAFDHARTPHREPHCYTYTNRQVIMRPPEWPLG